MLLLWRKSMNILWEPTEQKKQITNTRELGDYILAHVNFTEEMTKKDRAKMDARIMAKLKSGKMLSKKEMDYLRRTNPIMYAHAMRVQRIAEAVKEQLKHAKSKEEADRIVSSAISGIAKNDPDKEYIVAAVNRISTKFHKSGAYSKLPNTAEEADKIKKQSNQNTFSDQKEEDEFDLKNWSPLQEIYDNMPVFSVDA